MIYVSIDIETTGLDFEKDQVLEFGAIIEDTSTLLDFDKIPKFKAIIKYDTLSGSVFALNLNSRIIKILANIPNNYSEEYVPYIKKYNIIEPNYLIFRFLEFLNQHESFSYKSTLPNIVVAGKNFGGFDKQFIMRLPSFSNNVKFNHKSIDPAALYTKINEDIEPPSLSLCLERAGYKDEKVTHNALFDAWDVIRVLRKSNLYVKS